MKPYEMASSKGKVGGETQGLVRIMVGFYQLIHEITLVQHQLSASGRINPFTTH
jgi:hypothetical protein